MIAQNIVLTKEYTIDQMPPVNVQEALRYSGYMMKKLNMETGIGDEELLKRFDRVCREYVKNLRFRVCFLRTGVVMEDTVKLPFATDSKKLMKHLEGCSEAVMMAATLGPMVDRSVMTAEKRSPADALLMQGLGAERVEALCDLFCDELAEELKEEAKTVTSRFSPGYGDLPLTVQKDFFRILDINRKIGISLCDSMLMVPSKSVTAIAGIR